MAYYPSDIMCGTCREALAVKRGPDKRPICEMCDQTKASALNRKRVETMRSLLEAHHDDGVPHNGDDRSRLEEDASEWDEFQLPGLERFMLVESNTKGPELWITFHDTPADAANYHDGQEYPDDWNVLALYDLDENAVLEPETTTTFRPKETA